VERFTRGGEARHSRLWRPCTGPDVLVGHRGGDRDGDRVVRETQDHERSRPWPHASSNRAHAGRYYAGRQQRKPYNQGSIKDFLGSIKFFLDEIQTFYWEVATFDAFLRRELDVLRKALDYCQLDNDNATRMAKDPETWNPGECFRRSLAALELVFRDVFRD
jgi:hypothetical protein